MLTIYKNSSEGLAEITLEADLKGAWLQCIDPDQRDFALLASISGLSEKLLTSSVETSGSPQILKQKDSLLVMIHIPVADENDAFTTVPFVFILTPNFSVTLSRNNSHFLDSLRQSATGAYGPQNPSRFLFYVLQQSGAEFARYIQQIRRRTDELEILLRKAAANEQIYLLLNLEKGLTYITAALRGNIIVVEMIFRLSIDPKLQHFLHLQKDDEDLLESVILENKRALVTVETYSTILGSMMNAFSSVIANNLNHIMKFLASITIILSIPTVFSSFWSTSLSVPWQGSNYGFWYLSLISLAATVAAAYVLRQKKML